MPDQSMPKGSSITKNGSAESTNRDSVELNLNHLVTLCCIGIVVCFFLPWLSVLFTKSSGYDISKFGGKHMIVWLVPICAVIAVLMPSSEKSRGTMLSAAGLVPFVILLGGLYGDGMSLFDHLAYGAYACLGLGALLITISIRIQHIP